MVTRAIIYVCAFAAGVLAHPYFRDRIPNGYGVPNPCGSGIWEPVGHYDPAHHTQQKNPFALAFRAHGFQWSADLCNLDSDGDGRTNGVELGDPSCTWTVGSTPSGSATGHPGLCEPIGSAQCSHDPFVCGCHGPACTG